MKKPTSYHFQHAIRKVLLSSHALSEVFQQRMSQQHFGGLEGVDTILHADTEIKHDRRLNSVLDRCEKINLILKWEKCVFKDKEITYIAHKLTQEGIKPDDEKVRAIKDMPYQLTRKESKDYLVLSTTKKNSSPVLQLSRSVLKSFCERTLDFNDQMNKTKPFKE